MSTPLTWLLLFVALSAVFYASEVFLPSHGVLTILGTACLVAAALLCFAIDTRVGVGAVVALVVLGPIGLSVGVNVWQRTPVGRRMVLTAVTGDAPRPVVLVGQRGVSVTELRPMGECEFDDARVQARSEMGDVIPVRQPVTVIAFQDGVATVRPLVPSPAAVGRGNSRGPL